MAAAFDRVAEQQVDTFHLADAAREAELHGAVAAATEGADACAKHSAVEVRPGFTGDAGDTEFVIIVAIVVLSALVVLLTLVVFRVLVTLRVLVALCHRRRRLCLMMPLVLVAFLLFTPFFVLVPFFAFVILGPLAVTALFVLAVLSVLMAFFVPVMLLSLAVFFVLVIVRAFRVLVALTMFCTLTVFLAVSVLFAFAVFALARELDDPASRLGAMRTWTAFDFRTAAVGVVFWIGVEKNCDLGDPQVFPSRNEGEHAAVKPEPEAPGALFAVGGVFVFGRIEEQLPGVSEVTVHVKEAPAIAG